MNKKLVLTKQKIVKAREKGVKSARTAEFPQIKKAVNRAVREYGQTLQKLTKDD